MKRSLKGLFAATAAVAAVTLTACVPKTADKAKEKMEKADYTVEVADSAQLEFFAAMMGIEGLDACFSATKVDGDKIETVGAYYFETSEDAKNAMDKIEELMKESEEDYEIKRSGKVIYGGTEQAVKDFN